MLIEELRATIQSAHKNVASLESKIATLHLAWFTKITEVTDTINTNFSKFMASMGYAGEVSVVYKDERDYNSYGIHIGVKFRQNAKLEQLSRETHSGGEKAVAIALFTMAMQHISKVPFRCVDEINQGMDEGNERKVFRMLVDLCQEGDCQYFFISSSSRSRC